MKIKVILYVSFWALFSCIAYAQTGPSYFQLKDLPFVDVTHYGAKGDGIADDTDAIQMAISAVASTTRRYKQPVVFPAGNYRVTAPIVLNQYTTLIGVPLGSQFGGGKAGLIVDHAGNGIDLATENTIENLGLSKSAAFAYTGTGLSAPLTNAGGCYYKIKNCHTWDFQTGIFLNRWSSSIEDCSFTTMGTAAFVGILLAGPVNNTYIIRCRIRAQQAASTHKNIRITKCLPADSWSDPYSAPDGVFIQNCYFEPQYEGIFIEAASKVDISKSYFEYVARSAVNIVGTGDPDYDRNISVKVADNFFYADNALATSYDRAFVRWGAGRVVLKDNQMRGPASSTQGIAYGVDAGDYNEGQVGLHYADNDLIARVSLFKSPLSSATRKLLKGDDTVYVSNTLDLGAATSPVYFEHYLPTQAQGINTDFVIADAYVITNETWSVATSPRIEIGNRDSNHILHDDAYALEVTPTNATAALTEFPSWETISNMAIPLVATTPIIIRVGFANPTEAQLTTVIRLELFHYKTVE